MMTVLRIIKIPTGQLVPLKVEGFGSSSNILVELQFLKFHYWYSQFLRKVRQVKDVGEGNSGRIGGRDVD